MKWLLSILLLTLLSCVPKHAKFFRYEHVEGQPLRQLCVQPEIVQISSNFRGPWAFQLRAAMKYWNDATGKRLFTYGGRAGFTAPEKNETLGVILVDNAPPDVIQEWEEDHADDKRRTLAQVRYTDNVKKYCIVGAVIYVHNEAVDEWHNPYLLETLFRHELGHIIGLGHSDERKDLMYWAIVEDLNHPRDAHPSVIDWIQKI